jgi:ornithine cyclodeaminase/alanine dehydrogenase-like protein (mu-crystallin family)
VIRTFSEADIARVLSYPQLIPAMERALAAFSAGEVLQPVRSMITIEEAQRFLGVMPAVTRDGMGAKLVCFYPKNAAAGLPTHTASIALFDPETGRPLAFLDGRLITEMRTAAVSAVASQLLARPEASVLGILGSGVQARSHLEALRLVRAFRDIRVWSPRNARAFAKQFGIRAAPSAEEAVRGADVVVVATTSQTPVLSGAWLSPGTHINAVGAPRPTWRELDDDVLRKARIYVESREAATRESGDVIAAGQVVAEIGEVVTGAKRGRESAGEITLFKSVGVAIEDVVSADLVYRKAVQAAAAR